MLGIEDKIAQNSAIGPVAICSMPRISARREKTPQIEHRVAATCAVPPTERLAVKPAAE